jgi:hypothetical protein
VTELLYAPDGLLFVASAPTSAINMQTTLTLADKTGATRASFEFTTTFVRPDGWYDNNYLVKNESKGSYLTPASWETADDAEQVGATGSRGYLEWAPSKSPELVSLDCNDESALSDDGTLFACGAGRDNHIVLWDVMQRREVARWSENSPEPLVNVAGISFFANGSGLAAVQGKHDENGNMLTSVNLYSTATHHIVVSYSLPPQPGMPNVLAYQRGVEPILLYARDESPQDWPARDLVFYAFPPGRVR